MITLLLVAATTLGFVSGSIWLFTAALGFLLAKMYPVVLIFAFIAGLAFLGIRHYSK